MMYLQLAWLFCKTGLLTIGGGLASLPLLHTYLVRTGWLAEEEFVNMIALSQSTPGPIGINMATFVGYKAAGLGGAIVATAGMVAPSFLILILLARFLKAFDQHPLVRHAMAGLRPAAMGMIASAAWFVLRTSLFSAGPNGTSGVELASLLLLALLLPLCFLRRVHPVVAMVAGAGGGIAMRFLGVF